MKLKRVSGKGHNLPEAFISRKSSGTCFDFSTRDPTMCAHGGACAIEGACRMWCGVEGA